MRTTVWQIIKLAWAIWRAPYRKQQRIGQMLWSQRLFYIENDALIREIRGE